MSPLRGEWPWAIQKEFPPGQLLYENVSPSPPPTLKQIKDRPAGTRGLPFMDYNLQISASRTAVLLAPHLQRELLMFIKGTFTQTQVNTNTQPSPKCLRAHSSPSSVLLLSTVSVTCGSPQSENIARKILEINNSLILKNFYYRILSFYRCC